MEYLEQSLTNYFLFLLVLFLGSSVNKNDLHTFCITLTKLSLLSAYRGDQSSTTYTGNPILKLSDNVFDLYYKFVELSAFSKLFCTQRFGIIYFYYLFFIRNKGFRKTLPSLERPVHVVAELELIA